VKVTTVAPTVSIAKLPGSTAGIHPIYARHFIRRVRFSMPDPAQAKTDNDAMLAGYAVEMYRAEYADNAVFFTANVPESLDLDSTMDVIKSWLPDLKGTTIMVDGTRQQAPYERITEEQFATYAVTSVEDSTDEDCTTGACPVR
jgi:hypothetical protein